MRLIPVKPVYQRVLAVLASLAVGLIGAIAIGGLAVYYYLAPTLPEVAQLRDIRLQVPLRVYSRDGRLLAQIGEQRRIPVRFEDIPKHVVDAFIAAEDDRFFSHGGIDTLFPWAHLHKRHAARRAAPVAAAHLAGQLS